MFLLLSEDGNLYVGYVRILPALRLLKGRAVESRLVEGNGQCLLWGNGGGRAYQS